ncbi:MAG TPA: LysR family transcriptional regulator [Pseudobdellovibrionaceae bacterium]|nr:LysR family transcriptional regulator [Pseudobdellovibrionaceae bacterium]
MDLNEVAIYIQVIQTGSFSKAAQQLKMPKSTVSHKVSSLEKRLGITLIQRTTRKLNVTAAGQAYYRRCLQGLDEIKAAEQEIAAAQGEPHGLFRVTAPSELGGTVLPEIISKYTAKYPEVRVEVILTDRRVDLLSENVDLAIRAGDLKDSSLKAKRIGSVYFAPFASPKYLKAKGTPSHPKDLKTHQALQFTPLGLEDWKLTGPKGTLSAALSGRIIVNNIEMVKSLAVRGEGIAFLPTFFCFPEVKEGKLVRVLPEWRSTLSPVHFVYPAQKFVTPNLSAFIETATEDMKKMFADFEI